ncbi:MAG: GNAT family N-acyltransferase [Sulfitobacter sp.]|jgi:putative hemolysin|uniref:GNAT family N-acetyltransferase n=1 Tax=Sulfitobacter sp. TaxID=1903071 RepID=UPI003B606998|tara:strand:+ start:589 stop:1338 length:750 start_codon:yes stop_codon:yes gene_type:complete
MLPSGSTDSFGMIKGHYRAVAATSERDVEAAQALRAVCFGVPARFDADVFDRHKQHILIRDLRTGRLVSCFRLEVLTGSMLEQSYAAQFYDLAKLSRYNEPIMELGRFCVRPGVNDPDVVRIAWAALTQYVEAHGIKLLLGCTSFAGTDADRYGDVFALLHDRYQGPPAWRPDAKAPEVMRFRPRALDPSALKLAMQGMPPLLRTYLMMGGWVSDHAVVDRQLKTLHVFTGLSIDAIPEARKRLLRGLV